VHWDTCDFKISDGAKVTGGVWKITSETVGLICSVPLKTQHSNLCHIIARPLDANLWFFGQSGLHYTD
jgi:hypothetical protein